MSKSTRKAWAVAAAAALGASSLVLAPAAQATPGLAVTLAPSSGTNWSVFSTDSFSIDITLPALVADAQAKDNFAFAILNSDSTDLKLTFQFSDDSDGTFDGTLTDADDEVVVAQSRANDAVADNTAEVIDFSTGDATAAVFSDFQIDDGAGGGAGPDAPLSVGIELDAGAFEDGGASIQIVSWIDTDGDLTTIEADTSSGIYTLTFVDPDDVNVIARVERIAATDDTDHLNLADDTALVGNFKFNKPLNLDQVDLADWEFDLYIGGEAHLLDADDTTILFDDTYANQGAEYDDQGKILFRFTTDDTGDGTVLVEGTSYQVKIHHSDAAARVFSSNAYVPAESAAANDGVTLAVTEGDDALEFDDTTTTLRTGATSSTFVVQATAAGDDTAEANIPTIVRVKAITGTASVAGVAGTADEGDVLLWNTLTNADGQVEVTVTSSAEAGDSFTVGVYMLDSNGNADDTGAITATYADAIQSTMEMSSTVLAGESVTLTVSIADQFGVAVDDDSDGDALSVEIAATDTANLLQEKAVSGGKATFTFSNFLAAGETDILTVSAFTDETTDILNLDDSSVTLYASIDVAAVTVTDDEIDAVVQYVEFSDASVLDGDDPVFDDTASVSGTVIDESGAGIPGATVTVTGSNIQFEDADGNFAVGSISFNATEAGTFEFNVYTHTADDIEVTISSGGKSVVVTVAGALPTANGSISAADLLLSWNLPSTVLYNTTYAVTAMVTDVWGNPIENAEVTFTGEAAAQFNSDDTAVKSTNASGKATAYLRSLTDVSGLAAVSLTLADDINIDGAAGAEVADVGDTFTDVATTSWDESEATDEISEEITFLTSAAPVAPAASAKVNAGSFKGYVAVYARGYEGKRLSAKVGKDWVVVPSITNNQENGTLFRVVEFTGAGVDIAVRIYIDRVLMDTINLTTK